MALAEADVHAIIHGCDSDGVLAKLVVERLNGIEAFLSRKSLETNVTCLLCHKLLSQLTTGSWYDAA